MGHWLAEQLVRCIEPKDPEERARYWNRGGVWTAPFFAIGRAVRAVLGDEDARTLPISGAEQRLRRDATKPTR